MPELSQAEPQILHAVLDEGHSTRVATGLHVLGDGAQAAPGQKASLFRSQAGGNAFLDLPFQVVPQFLLELTLDSLSAEQRPKAKAGLCEPPRHVVSAPLLRHARLTIREMAVERRSHCRVSFASALRPARVTE